MGTELFPICFSLVSLCLSPRWALLQPHHSPPHHGALLQCPVGCSVPVPRLPLEPRAAVGPADTSQIPERLLLGHSHRGRGPGDAVPTRPRGEEARSPLGVPPGAAPSGTSGRGSLQGPWTMTASFSFLFFFLFVLLQIITIANCSFLERRSWTWAFATLKAR